MQDRIRRLFIGFGIMFGMQFLAAYFGLKIALGSGGKNPESTFYIMLGFTLAAYFGGGLAMGLLADRIIVLEPVLASLSSVVVNCFLASLIKANDLLFISIAVEKNAYVSIVVALGAVILAALVGALVGERIAIPTYDWLSVATMVVGLCSLVIGPLFLLAFTGTEKGFAPLPLPFLVIIVLMFLVVVGIGYVLFTRESHEADEISISPERRGLI